MCAAFLIFDPPGLKGTWLVPKTFNHLHVDDFFQAGFHEPVKLNKQIYFPVCRGYRFRYRILLMIGIFHSLVACRGVLLVFFALGRLAFVM